MTFSTFLRDFPTARQTRLGLLIGLPLALIFGQRAVAWADLQLKTWTAGQPLKAADLNAEFQKVKDEIALQTPKFYRASSSNQVTTSTYNAWVTVPGMSVTFPAKAGSKATATLVGAFRGVLNPSLYYVNCGARILLNGVPITAGPGKYTALFPRKANDTETSVQDISLIEAISIITDGNQTISVEVSQQGPAPPETGFSCTFNPLAPSQLSIVTHQ